MRSAFYSALVWSMVGLGGYALALTPEETEALDLGRRVLAMKTAIDHPESPGSMQAVRDLGLDSRYYTLARGWLSMKLQGDLQIKEARGAETPPAVESRIRFLQAAIRAIDLE